MPLSPAVARAADFLWRPTTISATLLTQLIAGSLRLFILNTSMTQRAQESIAKSKHTGAQLYGVDVCVCVCVCVRACVCKHIFEYIYNNSPCQHP